MKKSLNGFKSKAKLPCWIHGGLGRRVKAKCRPTDADSPRPARLASQAISIPDDLPTGFHAISSVISKPRQTVDS